jgi:hypothetical protein
MAADAPTGSSWWHWVVFNIPSATTSLPKGAIQSLTDFDADGYDGPCPPVLCEWGSAWRGRRSGSAIDLLWPVALPSMPRIWCWLLFRPGSV